VSHQTVRPSGPHHARPLTPAKAIVLAFLAAIAIGTVLLRADVAHAAGSEVDWLAALFTATSAVCVTGLIVVDTGATWSPFGQTVILLLIKAGGLGVLSLGALLALATGRRMGFSERLRLQAQTSAVAVGGIVRFVRRLVLYTTSIEAAGALLLWPRLARDDGLAAGAWSALFHAVSAFNNAGFSLYPDSFARYVGDPYVNAVIAGLFMLGGLGLVVVVDVALRAGIGGRGRHRVTLHTRLALTVTAVLVVTAWGTVAFLEWTNPATLGTLDLHERPLAAFFQAVTPRTAGFSTIDQSAYRTPTALFTMLLMFVGGNPGSTAGGIKTTSLALLLLAAWSAARGRGAVTAFGRTIGAMSVQKAAVLSTLGVLSLGAAATVITSTDPDLPMLAVLFEIVSAFGTVGLSMGITDDLSVAGRLTLVPLMIVGRIGLLTAAVALVEERPIRRLRMPLEDVIVG
jgi:trk system potassium uptake protein